MFHYGIKSLQKRKDDVDNLMILNIFHKIKSILFILSIVSLINNIVNLKYIYNWTKTQEYECKQNLLIKDI